MLRVKQFECHFGVRFATGNNQRHTKNAVNGIDSGVDLYAHELGVLLICEYKDQYGAEHRDEIITPWTHCTRAELFPGQVSLQPLPPKTKLKAVNNE